MLNLPAFWGYTKRFKENPIISYLCEIDILNVFGHAVFVALHRLSLAVALMGLLLLQGRSFIVVASLLRSTGSSCGSGL